MVQVAEDKQLSVEQCYEQLSAAEIKQLQADGKMGKTMCHGWLKTPYRAAGVAQPDLLMAFQYMCKGCPGNRMACQSWYRLCHELPCKSS